MKPHLLAILLLLVSLPLGLYAWLGYERARGEQGRVREQVLTVLADRLRDIDGQIAKAAGAAERDLDAAFSRLLNQSESKLIDAFPRDHRLVDMVYQFDEDSKLLSWSSGIAVDDRPLTKFVLENGIQIGTKETENTSSVRPSGWHTWFHGGGLQYIYWVRTGKNQVIDLSGEQDGQGLRTYETGGYIFGLEINRIALMADVIGVLPADTGDTPALASGRVALTGATGEVLYQWGSYDPPEGAMPTMSHPVSAPFESWRLDYFAPPIVTTNTLPSSTTHGVLAGLAALGITLISLGVYFYRESTREIRLASQRVSFVNQVSHELKTPLTNIRMYAELAEGKLDGESEAGECLGVVVSESARLSRMIQNVLSFSQHQRGSLKISRSKKVLDQVIRDVVDHFRPSLDEKGVEVELDLGAPEQQSIDADVCEQILGNLISNVEKYAAGGKKLTIRSVQDSGKASILIADGGPGVPSSVRAQIFDPFFRVSNKLSDGVSGTGLGLGISRSLARLHGGDLVLLDSEKGSHFQLTLET